MNHKLKDVVTTVGTSIKNAAVTTFNYVKGLFTQPAIEGEYIAKGAVDLSRRAFFTKSAVSTALVACLFILPSIAFAAVPASVTTAITDAVADVSTIGAAILGVIVVIASFMWMRRPIK